MIQQEFLNKLELSTYIVHGMTPAEKLNMLDKYNNIADAIINKLPSSTFSSDAENYKTILNDHVFNLFMRNTTQLDLQSYQSLFKMYQVCKNEVSKSNRNSLLSGVLLDTKIKNDTYSRMCYELSKKLSEIGVNCKDNISLDTNSLQVALQTFGLHTTEESDVPIQEPVAEPEDLDKFKDIFDDDETLLDEMEGDEDTYENEEEDMGEPEDYDDDIDISLEDILGEDEEEDTAPSEEDNEEMPNETKEEDDDTINEESDLYKELEKELGNYLSGHVNAICNVLSSIYSAGFTRAQAGILVSREGAPSPLVAIRKIDNNNDMETLKNMGIDVTDADKARGYKTVSIKDNGTFQDRIIYNAVVSSVPQLQNYAENTSGGSIPDVNTLLNNDVVCYKLHLQFQSANIDYCTKENSEIKIKDWVNETQLKKNGVSTFTEWRQKVNDNKKRLKSYKSMVRPWYEWSVKKILIKSIIDAGITDTSDINAINNIVNKVTSNLRNVAVMSVRSPGAEYEIKISSSNISVDQREQMKETLINKLTSQLNLAGSNEIVVKQIAEDKFNSLGVLTLSIVLDQKKANASVIFAGDIVNELKNEERPSWSHALLGMSEDRQWLYWDDFMNPAKAGPANRVYCIYAASRAGKGNMTAALLANALCDGRKVYYTDGKPETGTCLGELAWLAGKEAYVYDGQRIGSAPFSGYMEKWTNGLRTQEQLTQYINKLPSELFENSEFFNTERQEKFLGVMRYLKSLALCAATVSARNKGELPIDNWDIWIFDEMTKMSELETQVREKFMAYLGAKGVKGIKKGQSAKGNDILVGLDESKFDREMIDTSSDKFDAGVAYIYNWLSWTRSIMSSISEAATIALGKSSTNIIFIFQNASWLINEQFSTTIGQIVMALECTKIVGNGGLAPTCKTYGEETTRKKPWYTNVINTGKGWWGISKSPDIRTSEVDVFKPFSVWTVPIDTSTNERLSKPGEDKDPKYMYGYIMTLCEAFGVDVASVLNTAYTYANNAVSTLGFATSLEEYMYDCSNLCVGETSADFSKLLEERAARDNDGETSLENTPPTVVKNTVSMGEDDNSILLDEDEAPPIDFGFGGSMPNPEPLNTSGPSPIPGQRTNSTGENILQGQDQNKNVIDKANEEVEQIKSLRLMTTRQLRAKNFSDNVLEAYYNNILNKNGILANNNFDYTNRDKTQTRGLYQAAITFSSISYMEKEIPRFSGIVNKLRDQATSQIRALNDRYSKWKFMLGMIDDYMNDILQYDELPSEDKLREYQQKYLMNINFDTGYAYDDEDNNQSGQGYQNVQQLMNEDGTFEDDSFDQRAYYDEDPYEANNIFNSNNRQGTIDITPPPNGDTVRLSLDNYIETSAPRWHTIERFKKALFESANGTAYEFKKRWDYVLKKIAERHPDRALVRKIAFTELHVIVNGKMMMLNNLIGGEDDIQITDILRIKDTFKKFPMIQSITFDGPTTQCLIDEYGTTAQEVWSIFQENRALKVIEIIIPETNQQLVLKRETFPSMQDQFNRAMGIKIAQMQYEQFGSNYNNRLEEKSPGYISRMLKNGKSKASSWFQNRPKVKTNRKPIVSKRMKFAAGAVGILALGSVIGLPGLIVTGVSSAVGYFKARG